MTLSFPLDWWLERLEGVRPVGDGYTALCPAHEDRHNSVSIREVDGGTVVHCFRGCTYGSILKAVDEPKLGQAIRVVSRKRATVTPRSWWEEYTQVPAGDWESWGMIFTRDGIAFTWSDLQTRKLRPLGEKKFFWEPDGSARPPLWPSIPEELPHTIWITEGESDCGVLRYLGFEAFAMTKGAAATSLFAPVWRALALRGVKEIVFTADFDAAGMKMFDALIQQIRETTLNCFRLEIDKIIDPLLGEKDIRDVWVRLRDIDQMTEQLEVNVQPLVAYERAYHVSAAEFLTMRVEEHPWLVENALFQETIGMIVGAPKLGKSWMALDLGISIASGTPFLGKFPTLKPGPVVYISKEDPTYSLQDRMIKILGAKGIKGTVDVTPGRIMVRFPPRVNFPFYLDLSRGFLFSPDHVGELIDWLRELKDQFGHISAVIFDPVLRMILGVDEFKVSEINHAIFEPASEIVKEIGTSVLAVHHRSKGDRQGKDSYGSIAFHAFTDSTLYLMGSEPDPDGWVPIHSEFKSAPEFSWALRFNDLEDNYEVEVDFKTRRELQAEAVSASQQIIGLLEKDPGLTVGDIREQLESYSVQQLRQILRKLEKDGRVHHKQDHDIDPPQDVWYSTED